ncbi:hypothetical protein BC739_004385 [Kutzneria viridogrisea]|uniref:Glyoxalase-like domain-containing protein n=1 Tax=Kutzneria viridogrisea TaxID=47990 RepID=A0ABR6BJX6_9PSEU|nr:hypothetical protein [Kutzneria viridogrisea]
MDIDYLDHTVFITRDFGAAWRAYEQLGFTLSPESRHFVTERAGGPLVPSCTANRCALFGESFIELIGVVDESAPDPWRVRPLVDRYNGLHGYSFGCHDSEAAERRLRAVGLSSSGVLNLQRDVDTPDGVRTVRARSVHIDRARTPEGIVHTAEHLTRQFVHQQRYLVHANGARGLAAVYLVVPTAERDEYTARYELMLDRPARDNAFQLRTGRVEIVTTAEYAAIFPGSQPPAVPGVAAQTVAVTDLRQARELVHSSGFATVDTASGFFVAAAGAVLGFTSAGS